MISGWTLFTSPMVQYYGDQPSFDLFSQSRLMNFLFNRQIDLNFWAVAELPGNALKFQGWIYGVLGAVIAGWGTLLNQDEALN